MRLAAADQTVGHADFYSASTAIFTLIFISISILLLTPKMSDPGPSGNPPWWYWIAAVVSVAWGVVIPLAILAGFMQDTFQWRLLSFIMNAVELLYAAFLAGLAVAQPTSRAKAGSGDVPTTPQGD